MPKEFHAVFRACRGFSIAKAPLVGMTIRESSILAPHTYSASVGLSSFEQFTDSQALSQNGNTATLSIK